MGEVVSGLLQRPRVYPRHRERFFSECFGFSLSVLIQPIYVLITSSTASSI